MKNTFITSALVAVLGSALASAPVTVKAVTSTPTQTPAATSTGSTTPSKPAKKKSANTAIPKGSTISAIDASSVTLKTSSGDVTAAITPETKFQFGTAKKNTPATAADFAAGDAVTGSYIKNADGSDTLASLRKKAAK